MPRSDLIKKIRQLFLITDLMASRLGDTTFQKLYDQVRKMGIYDKKDLLKITQKINEEAYAEMRKNLDNLIKDNQDPIEKSKIEKIRDELDGIFNLFETVDDNSSEEHKQRVVQNMVEVVKKFKNLHEHL
jgi:hypothetical protein